MIDAPMIDAPMIDGAPPDAEPIDAAIDAPMIDAPPPDAAIDAFGSCSIAANCPTGQSCNLATGFCETACGASHTNCNGGCCDGAQCVGGDANAACGHTGGMCSACADRTPTCSSGACTAVCGNTGDGTCGNGFCCQASSHLCVDGTQQTTCGFAGMCTNCGSNPNGHRCLTPAGGPYTCGCTAATDCRGVNAGVGLPGQACNTTTNSCTNVCNTTETTACNGGCCGDTGGGNFACFVGNSAADCGSGGGLCSDCQLTSQTCVNNACQ